MGENFSHQLIALAALVLALHLLVVVRRYMRDRALKAELRELRELRGQRSLSRVLAYKAWNGRGQSELGVHALKESNAAPTRPCFPSRGQKRGEQ